jgi:site-specific recombinase XerD
LGWTGDIQRISMRASFITTLWRTGCSLEDVQRAAGHREPGTTKLYDRRSYNQVKSASFLPRFEDKISVSVRTWSW